MGRQLLPALSAADSRSEDSILAAENGSSASDNAGLSQTVVVSKSVGFRNPKMSGSACSENSISNIVANSADNRLHVGKSTRELCVGRKKGFVPQHGTGYNHDVNIVINTGCTNQPLRMHLDTGAQIFVSKLRLIPDNISIHTDT